MHAVSRDLAAPSPERNCLLAGLPRASVERVFRHLALIRIARGSAIADGAQGGDALYFPVGLVAGLVCRREGGRPAWAATIGSEGLIGDALALPCMPPFSEAFALVEGFCYRLPGRHLRHDHELGGALWSRVVQYEQRLLAGVERNLRCAGGHSTLQRLGRVLLGVFDRSPPGILYMTPERMGRLLDIPLEDLRIAAAALEARHAIHWSRGRIQLRHRARLRAASCSCYGAGSWPSAPRAPRRP